MSIRGNIKLTQTSFERKFYRVWMKVCGGVGLLLLLAKLISQGHA